VNKIIAVISRLPFKKYWVALKKKKDYAVIGAFVIAAFLFVTSIQSYLFYKEYKPRIAAANEKFFTLVTEKNRSILQRQIQQQFTALIVGLKGAGEPSIQINNLYELLAQHFRESPLEILVEVRSELSKLRLGLEEKFKEAVPEGVSVEVISDISRLESALDQLRDIYTVPYAELRADLQNPPWYLMPTASTLKQTSGYLSSITFNSALYLAQIGELGTARVLLTGLHATASESEFIALINYGLGRLQWELFLGKADPENYFQAVKFLRESMKIDPEASLPKRLFDYMLSLTPAETQPGQGKGDPTQLTEGEAGTFSDRPPIF